MMMFYAHIRKVRYPQEYLVVPTDKLQGLRTLRVYKTL